MVKNLYVSEHQYKALVYPPALRHLWPGDQQFEVKEVDGAKLEHAQVLAEEGRKGGSLV